MNAFEELEKLMKENEDVLIRLKNGTPKPIEGENKIKNENWTTYWWIIDDENSDLCGEEFFTELKDAGRAEHNDYVLNLFPNENPRCLGQVTEEEAEMMGLDTY